MSDSDAREQIDVAVIGGGPAGSAAATLLARDGRSVALFEKAAHPRFHIGESMLPNSLPILQRLGVLDQVEALGLRKNGADFTCEAPAYDSQPKATQRQTFRFDRALGSTPDHAVEVRRADFDALLFANAGQAGAHLFTTTSVSNVARQGRAQTLTYRRADGSSGQLKARFVLDASGRDALLARRNGWLRTNRKHSSAAIFGHFAGVPRRTGADAGNISIYWFEHGWIWMIPLKPAPDPGSESGPPVMSIGAVCWPDFLRAQRSAGASLEQILERALSPAAAERTRAARPLGPVRSEGNYSYRARQAHDKGQHLIGDAFGFIDPVFSSGVYLALASAEDCVPMVNAWLDDQPVRYRILRNRHRRRTARRMRTFAWFIYRFTTPAMRDLFREPRNDLRIEQAVISVLAGDGDGAFAIRWRVGLFKLLYQGYRLKRWLPALATWQRRRRNLAAQSSVERFGSGTSGPAEDRRASGAQAPSRKESNREPDAAVSWKA